MKSEYTVPVKNYSKYRESFGMFPFL